MRPSSCRFTNMRGTDTDQSDAPMQDLDAELKAERSRLCAPTIQQTKAQREKEAVPMMELRCTKLVRIWFIASTVVLQC